MRIALVTHYFPAHRGGIELVAAELARRLAVRHGADISWHASDCDAAPSIPGVKSVPAESCNAIERRIGVPYPIWSLGALWRVGQAARAADAVHLHDCLYLPNLVAYAVARISGRPILVTQHVGMIPYRSLALRTLLRIAYGILGRIVLGGASRVVFVSDSVRRYFGGFVRFKAPPVLIANGVDTSVFRPLDEDKRAALRAQLGIEHGAPLLLFVGRFVEKKGLPSLRELARRLPDARWIFAGWGPLDPEGWGLANVRVFRDYSGALLAQLYQAADLLVLPSVGEGFPLVVQEAMACGTPALVGIETAAGCPDAGDVLPREDVGGTDGVPRWERRIRELTAAAGRGDLRRAAAAYAAANWSWEHCAGRYAELLRQLALRDNARS
jgi:glycosyltransferase involved in cell wall biosynthesis